MSRRDIALAVLVALVWGMNFVVAKIGLVEWPPIFMMALRFTLVALLLAPFVAVPRDRLRQIAALSVTLGAMHFSLMFTGLRDLDGSTAAITVQLQVPFSALLAWLALGDRPGWRRVAGIAVAFGGVVLIAGEPRFQGGLLPLGLVTAAALMWAIANIQVKKMGPVGELSLLAWTSIMATPQLFILSWLLEDGQIAALSQATWRGWGALAYQVLGVVMIGYVLWYRLLHRYGVNQTVAFTLLVPVFGVASSVLLLNETMSLRILAGGVVTILGVAIIVMRRPALAGPSADPIPDDRK